MKLRSCSNPHAQFHHDGRKTIGVRDLRWVVTNNDPFTADRCHGSDWPPIFCLLGNGIPPVSNSRHRRESHNIIPNQSMNFKSYILKGEIRSANPSHLSLWNVKSGVRRGLAVERRRRYQYLCYASYELIYFLFSLCLFNHGFSNAMFFGVVSV